MDHRRRAVHGDAQGRFEPDGRAIGARPAEALHREPQYGSVGYDGHHDWPVLEGRYALAVLFEFAATLGLLDVEYTDPAGARNDFCHMWGADWTPTLSRYDGLLTVRLNPFGQYCAGLLASYSPTAQPAPDRGVEVLANFDIVALADLPSADRLLLDTYAARTSDRVWTLSAASLLAAAEAGRAPADLASFLADRAIDGPPGTVRTLIDDDDDDVAARAGRVRDLGQRRLVECADPHVATLIACDRTLGTSPASSRTRSPGTSPAASMTPPAAAAHPGGGDEHVAEARRGCARRGSPARSRRWR